MSHAGWASRYSTCTRAFSGLHVSSASQKPISDPVEAWIPAFLVAPQSLVRPAEHADADTGEALGQVGRSVRRPVVDDHDLDRRVVLRQQALEALGEEPGAVEDGHDDGDQGWHAGGGPLSAALAAIPRRRRRARGRAGSGRRDRCSARGTSPRRRPPVRRRRRCGERVSGTTESSRTTSISSRSRSATNPSRSLSTSVDETWYVGESIAVISLGSNPRLRAFHATAAGPRHV